MLGSGEKSHYGRVKRANMRREKKTTNSRTKRATAQIIVYPLYLVRANTPRKEEHDRNHER